jgi:beta-mannosidase
MISQVERIFGVASSSLDEFARQSQVSQAEAVKFFIERFRVQKWRKTGILWWNIADGWPQVSDAVVDWYGVKKLAYHYITRSQKPVCLICDEPKEGLLDLLAVNDTQSAVKGEYTAVELVSGEEVASGAFEVEANGKTVVCKLPEKKNGFYLIRWTSTGGNGVNHFVCTIGDGWTWEAYKNCMEKAGFYNEFEGF